MLESGTNLCKILSYEMQIEPASYPTGITQVASNCANSIDCQTVAFDTSIEKVYLFKFMITSDALPGFNQLVTQVLTVNVTCGAEV